MTGQAIEASGFVWFVMLELIRCRCGLSNGEEPGAMITIEECIAMCGLTQDEVLAIAEHEHIPEIAAAALGQYLLTQDDGTEKISAMLRDDIRLAIHRNDRAHARQLFMALRHFLSSHPQACTRT